MTPSPTVPASIVAGDTIEWRTEAPDHPATDGWVATFTAVNAAQRYTATASADDAAHLFVLAASATALYTPGQYQWRISAARAGVVNTIASGRVTIEPSFASAVDARSSARRMLDAVEAVIEGRASSDIAEYQIAGRSLRHTPLTDLLALRDRLRIDVAREESALRVSNGLSPAGRISVRFGP